MTPRKFIVGIALGCVCAGDVQSAEARDRRVRDQFSATTVSHPTDVNNDGITASLSTGIEEGTLGRFTLSAMSEVLAPLPTPVTCPANTLECPLLYGHAVLIHQLSGDQLYADFTSGILCFNPANGTYTFSGKGEYSGGTGRCTGATGSFVGAQTGATVVGDAAGHAFGATTGTVTGTLIPP